MSPEQTQGDPIDARTDQYAFGCMLYQMLTGRTPYIGSSSLEIMRQHIDPAQLPIPPRQLVPELQLSDSLEQTILRLLAKPPDQRFTSMLEVEQALQKELDLLLLSPDDKRRLLAAQTDAPQGSPGSSLVLGGWRVPLWALLPGLLVLLLGAAAVVYRLVTIRRSERLHLDPGELAQLRERAVTLLKSELAPEAPKELRLAAVVALGQSHDSSLSKPLEPLLQDNDPLVQVQAAEALGQLAEPGALGALQAALQKSSQPVVRVALAGALRQLREPSAQRQLTEALSSPVSEVQFNAAMLLCEDSTVPQAQTLLRSYMDGAQTPQEVRQSILSCLAQSGDTPARQKLSEDARGRGPERLTAAGRLLQLGDDSGREVLRRTLRQGGPEALLAARFLAGPEEPASLERLAQVAADPGASAAARRLAAEGLGDSGDVFYARLLAELLGPKEKAPLHNAAAAAIVRLAAQDPGVLTANSMHWAQGALADRSWLLRQAAVSVLADAPSEDAVRLLAQLAKDSDVRIRKSALRALGRRVGQAALPILREGLVDPEMSVRLESIRALGRILGSPQQPGDQDARTEAAKLLRTYFEWATATEQAAVSGILAQLGDPTYRAKLLALGTSADPELRRALAASPVAGAAELGRALADPVFMVRLAAAQQLATRGDRRAATVLREAVQLGGLSAVTAYGLLLRLGEATSGPADLSQTLGAPEVGQRLAAVAALASLPTEVALPLLLKAAQDPEPQVRSRAAAVAASLPTKDGPAAGTPLWRLLLTDRDAAVRARAQALLARFAGRRVTVEPAPELDLGDEPTPQPPADKKALGTGDSSAVPAEPEPAPGSVADGETALVLDAEPGLLYQLDQRTWQLTGPQPIPIPPGPHHLSSLAAQQDFTAVAQKRVTIHLETSRVERLARGSQDSFNRHDYRKAQRQLDQAISLCGQDPHHAAPCAILAVDMVYRLGQIREAQLEWPAAMNEYQRVSLLFHKVKSKAEVKARVEEAMARLRPRVCKVVVRQQVHHRCVEDIVWVGPGNRTLKVGGKLEQIQAQAQGELEVGTCK